MTEPKIKRTFLIQVFIPEAKKEFGDGMGPGVLASQEITFNLPQKKYDSPMFALSLSDYETKLLNEIVKTRSSEIK